MFSFSSLGHDDFLFFVEDIKSKEKGGRGKRKNQVDVDQYVPMLEQGDYIKKKTKDLSIRTKSYQEWAVEYCLSDSK